ncbi:MAG: hypothetical protein Q9226_007888, partial [Calogaya cf. arnoldii]
MKECYVSLGPPLAKKPPEVIQNSSEEEDGDQVVDKEKKDPTEEKKAEEKAAAATAKKGGKNQLRHQTSPIVAPGRRSAETGHRIAPTRSGYKDAKFQLRLDAGETVAEQKYIKLQVNKEVNTNLEQLAITLPKIKNKLPDLSIFTRDPFKLLKKALQNLSTDLNVLYDETPLRIEYQNIDERILAEKALRWVACTYRPLHAKALQEALAIEPGDLDFGIE